MSATTTTLGELIARCSVETVRSGRPESDRGAGDRDAKLRGAVSARDPWSVGMAVPAHLAGYPCDDYFGSEYARAGFWDEASQVQVVVTAAAVEELPGRAFLAIGRPGVDGILFGYRADRPGLWAYYPIEGDFRLLAATVVDLVRGWASGDISV